MNPAASLSETYFPLKLQRYMLASCYRGLGDNQKTALYHLRSACRSSIRRSHEDSVRAIIESKMKVEKTMLIETVKMRMAVGSAQ